MENQNNLEKHFTQQIDINQNQQYKGQKTNFTQPNAFVQDLQNFVNDGHMGYPCLNYEPYESSIINHLKKSFNFKISNQNIALSFSCLNTIAAAIQVVIHECENEKKENEQQQPQINIIIQTPVYPKIIDVVKCQQEGINSNIILQANELKISKTSENSGKYNGGKLEVDFDDLETKLSQKNVKKILIINSPHAPSGTEFTVEELQKIIKLCEANDTLLISNEIFADFTIFDQKHIVSASLASDFQKSKIISIISPEKSFNMQGIKGFYCVIGNQELRQKYIMAQKRNGLMFTNVFAQKAIELAYKHFDNFSLYKSEVIEKNYQRICSIFEENKNYSNEISMVSLHTGYLAFVDYQQSHISQTQCLQMSKELDVQLEHLGDYYLPPRPEIKQFLLNVATIEEKTCEFLKKLIAQK